MVATTATDNDDTGARLPTLAYPCGTTLRHARSEGAWLICWAEGRQRKLTMRQWQRLSDLVQLPWVEAQRRVLPVSSRMRTPVTRPPQRRCLAYEALGLAERAILEGEPATLPVAYALSVIHDDRTREWAPGDDGVTLVHVVELLHRRKLADEVVALRVIRAWRAELAGTVLEVPHGG